MRKNRGTPVLALLLSVILVFGLTGCSAVADELDKVSGLLRSAADNEKNTGGQTEPAETAKPIESEAPSATAEAPVTDPAPETPSSAAPEPPAPEGVALLGVNYGIANKSVPFTEGDWSRIAARTEFVQFALDRDFTGDYPQLDAALYYWSKGINETYMAWVEEAAAEMKSAPGADQAASPAAYRTLLGTVVRADTSIVSLLCSAESYRFGAAHPDYGYQTAAFDPASGKPLALSDVLKDRAGFLARVGEELNAQYGKDSFFSDVKEMVGGMADEDLVWTADNGGVTLYFNPYILAPFAEGEFVVTIPYAGNENLFADRLTARPASYTAVQGTMPGIRDDVTGDGIPEAITVTLDDHGMYDDVSGDVHVHINDKDYTVWTGDSLGRKTAVVHPGNGRSYLYIINAGYNGWDCLVTVDVTGGGATYVKEEYLSLPVLEDGDLVWAYEQAIARPEHFYLSHVTDALSSNNAIGVYRAGADGAPELTSPWYELQYFHRLTIKAEVTVKTVDNDGKVTGEKTLAPGDEIILYRTDDKTWVDAWLNDADGTMVRIFADLENWPLTLEDGRPASDVFDGMMFAG